MIKNKISISPVHFDIFSRSLTLERRDGTWSVLIRIIPQRDLF